MTTRTPDHAMLRHPRLPFLALLAFTGALAGAAADTRDLIILKSGQPKYAVIDSELSDKLIIRNSTATTAKPVDLRMHEVKSWEYLEMRDGYWPQAVQARDQGRLAIAADLFNALATTGPREWQKIYGAFEEGVCWELLGEWEKAADAFGRAALVNPEHRLTMDSQYRQGFAQARLKKNAEALAIADALAELYKKNRDAAAEARNHAIRAVLAANAGDSDGLKKEGRSAVFPREDTAAAVQFGTFFAEALRQGKMQREAKSEYERLLALSDLDAATKVPIQLGYARSLMDAGDNDSALVELLRVDALPYGTIDAKCEIRYLAGKLLADQVAAAKAKGEAEGATEWVRSQERTARLLLAASSGSTSTVAAKAAAAQALEAMGPDPDLPAPKEGPKEGPKAGETPGEAPVGDATGKVPPAPRDVP